MLVEFLGGGLGGGWEFLGVVLGKADRMRRMGDGRSSGRVASYIDCRTAGRQPNPAKSSPRPPSMLDPIEITAGCARTSADSETRRHELGEALAARESISPMLASYWSGLVPVPRALVITSEGRISPGCFRALSPVLQLRLPLRRH
jgi:hypothetical protein